MKRIRFRIFFFFFDVDETIQYFIVPHSNAVLEYPFYGLGNVNTRITCVANHRGHVAKQK